MECRQTAGSVVRATTSAHKTTLPAQAELQVWPELDRCYTTGLKPEVEPRPAVPGAAPRVTRGVTGIVPWIVIPAIVPRPPIGPAIVRPVVPRGGRSIGIAAAPARTGIGRVRRHQAAHQHRRRRCQSE